MIRCEFIMNVKQGEDYHEHTGRGYLPAIPRVGDTLFYTDDTLDDYLPFEVKKVEYWMTTDQDGKSPETQVTISLGFPVTAVLT
jgi:hypothetical protein